MKKLLFILFFYMIQSASAFTLNGNDSNFKGWASGEVKFAINASSCPAGVDIQGLMEESFSVWNNISGTNLKLSIVGTTTSTDFSDPVTVYCVTSMSSAQEEDSIPGYASVMPSGDYATAGYLVLNATAGNANISRFNREVLKVIIAHEVGHVIGLGHSHDTHALMYYSGSMKTTLSLSQDDVDGIEYLYPRNELGSDKPLGCALVKMNNSGPGGFSKILSILLLMLLPILLSTYLRGKKLIGFKYFN
jgi:Matrixin